MNGLDPSSDALEGPVDPSNASSVPSLMTLRQQRAAAFVVAVCIIVMLTEWGLGLVQRERRIEIERTLQTRTIHLTIDLNHATWPELTLLPEISETMARRIVEFRERKGRFESLDELKQVRGIGPRTFDRLRPYLQPITPGPVAVAHH